MSWLTEMYMSRLITLAEYDGLKDDASDLSNDAYRTGYPLKDGMESYCAHAELMLELEDWAYKSGIESIMEHYSQEVAEYLYGWSERWEEENGYSIWYDENVSRWRNSATGRFHLSPYYYRE